MQPFGNVAGSCVTLLCIIHYYVVSYTYTLHAYTCVRHIHMYDIAYYMMCIIHCYSYYLKLFCLVEWEWGQHVLTCRPKFYHCEVRHFQSCLCRYTPVPLWNARVALGKLLFQGGTLMPQKLASWPLGSLKEVGQFVRWSGDRCFVQPGKTEIWKRVQVHKLFRNHRLNHHTNWRGFSRLYLFLASSSSLFHSCHCFC